jgi:uncharacterized membrane protein
MTRAYRSAILRASADTVWALVGDFHGLAGWLPGVESSEPLENGSKRRLATRDGKFVLERLVERNVAERQIKFEVLVSALPVENYFGTWKVTPRPDGMSLFEWSAEFQPKGVSEGTAIARAQRSYQNGIRALIIRFGGDVVRGSVAEEIPAPAETVWAVVRDFHGLPKWLSSLASSEPLDGGIARKVVAHGGKGTMIERLAVMDEAAMSYAYTLESAPMPVCNYIATARVEAKDAKTCMVTWSFEFEPLGTPPERAEANATKGYRFLLGSLKAYFSRSA